MTVSEIYETIQEIEAAGENPNDQKTWDRYAEPRQPMKIWRLCFMDKKGGYRERLYTDAEKLAKACARLGCEAIIKDADKNVIGRVTEVNEPRRKWGWYFELQNDCDTRTHFNI